MTALLRFLTAYGNVGYENKFIVPLLLCVTIFLIAGYALRQPEIFSDRWDKFIRENDRKSVPVLSMEKDQNSAVVHLKENDQNSVIAGLRENDQTSAIAVSQESNLAG